jgi:hypothetical protein
VTGEAARGGWRVRVHGTARRVGARGLFLLNLAVMDLLWGITLAWPTPDQVASPRYQVITHMLPGVGPRPQLVAWAGLWWLTAAVCLWYAGRENDDVAYGCAFALKVAWAIINAIAYLLGSPYGASQAITWIGFAVAVGIMSRMPEPVRRRR